MCDTRASKERGLLRVRLLGGFLVDAFLYLLEPNLEYAIGFVDDEDLHENDACDIEGKRGVTYGKNGREPLGREPLPGSSIRRILWLT